MSPAGAMARSNLAHAAGAFALMGSWAMIANAAHPSAAMVGAGLVQGTLSAAITLGLKAAIEWMSARFSGVAARFGPPVAAFAVSSTLLALTHRVAGTPEIGATIAVPLVVSTTYATLYSATLWKAKGRTDG